MMWKKDKEPEKKVEKEPKKEVEKKPKIDYTEQELADWQRACRDGVTDKTFEEYLPLMREGAKKEEKA